MKSEQITTSAALYFDPNEKHSVTLSWFERARELFADYNLSPIFFTANGGNFAYDDCYVLAECGEDVPRFGEIIRAQYRELIGALCEGEINYLGLDSTDPGADDREYWRAMTHLSSSGDLFMGVREQFNSDPASILCRAYSTAKGLHKVRYGFAYKCPLSQRPDCYASGHTRRATSISAIFEEFQARREGTYEKNADELWSEELRGERRHLTGLFRGAYPANILSESHVRSAALMSRGIGKLTELDTSLWLWELSDSELPAAESMLESRGVLVRQADQGKQASGNPREPT